MRRLYTRIYMHFIAVLLVVGLTSSLVFTTGWRVAFLRSWTLKLARHAALLVASAGDDPAARQQMVRHLSEELDLDVTVRAPDGRVLVSTGKEIPPITGEDAEGAQREPTIVHGNHGWYVAAPIRDHKSGALLGILQTFPMHRFSPVNLMRPLAMLALVLLIVAMATGPLARRISRPVERLTEASRRLGAGDLSYRVPIPGCDARGRPRRRRWQRRHQRLDELGELTRVWNDMAERVENLVRGQRELLANVSHELRSPLARIRVALELLPEDGRTTARVADVKLDLSELERLIDDVLTTSRLDATGLPVHVDEVAIGPLLKQLADRADHDPATAGKTVRLVDGADAFGTLAADGALLKRALWNLVENAAKYGAPPITLAAERRGDQLALIVSDEGPGIPPADRERVFDPFFRADKARTPGARGFGLGLTLARRVAEVHGGSIGIDGLRPDGTGCRITLLIPMVPAGDLVT